MTGYLPSRVAGTFHANHDLSPGERGEFNRSGVTNEVLDADPPVKVGYVSFLGADRFEFEQHCRVTLSLRTVRAFLLLAEDTFDEAEDVVAWMPALRRASTWLGWAWALGAGQTYAPRISDEPASTLSRSQDRDREERDRQALPVHRDPLSWLRAGRRGLVILKPRVAAGWLCDAGPLLAEDRPHGLELREALARPAPRILINHDIARRAVA